MVVGAPFEDSNAIGVNGNQANDGASSAGAAYVFVRAGSNWSQQAYLKASNTGVGDQFGWSVAVSGDSVVVGARFEASNATGVDANGAFTFPTALADGSGYAVTVLTQPGNPTQTCTVSSGDGTLAGANITTVAVTCVTYPPMLSLSSASLSFGGVMLGNSATATVTISSTGSGDLSISQLTASGAPFSIARGS